MTVGEVSGIQIDLISFGNIGVFALSIWNPDFFREDQDFGKKITV